MISMIPFRKKLKRYEPSADCDRGIAALAIGMLVALVAIFWVTAFSWASTVTLAWDPNPPEQKVAGYRIYQSDIGGQYDKATQRVADVTGPNTTQAAISIPVDDGRTVHFVATAYDSAGNESAFSNEVAYEVPDVVAPEPPKVLKLLERIAAALEGIQKNGLRVQR